MSALLPVITNAGISLQESGAHIEITEMAIGDSAWNPDETAISLSNERDRVDISGTKINENQTHISGVVSSEKNYWVKEIGFYLSDGTLFAIYSNANETIAYKHQKVDLIISIDLILTRTPADSVNVSVNSSVNLPASTKIQRGIIRISDDEEARQESSDIVCVTPKQLGDSKVDINNALLALAISQVDQDKRHLDNLFKINALRDFIDSQVVSIKALIQKKYDDVLGGVGEAGNTLKKLYDLIENVKLSLMPRYAIIMWARPVDEIPDGFKLCDGENGTPNLIDKFIKSSSVAGQTGGSNTHTHSNNLAVNNHTLSVSQMPSHSHSIANVYQVTDSSSGGDVIARISGSKSTGATGGSASHGHTLSGEIDASSNEPEYYTMCLIMKI